MIPASNIETRNILVDVLIGKRIRTIDTGDTDVLEIRCVEKNKKS